jgi:predicted nucleic acid-binding protein
VFSAILSSEPQARALLQALSAARIEGALLISGIVFMEALAYPKMTPAYLEQFLDDAAVEVDFNINEPIWREAGSRFARQAARRRAARDHTEKRMLADFVVGAHALLRADRLLTLDTNRYRRDFPELRLLRVP